MQNVDYLIIGAGMAGLTLKRFLLNDATVVVDPEPGGYKIGESIIPEHFYNLEVRKLVPEIRRLRSYTEKFGSIFITDTEVASFPLPPELADLAMHIERSELERLMINQWNITIRRERVRRIDLGEKTVLTDKNKYKVTHQILDCSGPAMVVAKELDEQSEIFPAHAIWGYYDVEEACDQRFYEEIMKNGKAYKRFDVPEGRLLPEKESPGWRPSRTTILSRIRDGVWLWQIPLFRGTRLSAGVVSRKGKISPKEFFSLVEQHHAPHYKLRLRPLDKSSVYNYLHRRNHFAKRAKAASTMDFILLADAFGFADPIYSVGTGLAVNKAIQVAALLNEGGWSEEKSVAYNAQYEDLIAAAVEAFNFWYSGALLSEDSAATHVQTQFLQGEVFPAGIPRHYGQQIRSAFGDRDSEAHDRWSDLHTWEADNDPEK